MFGISKDERLMGEFASSARRRVGYGAMISLVATCVLALLWLSIKP